MRSILYEEAMFPIVSVLSVLVLSIVPNVSGWTSTWPPDITINMLDDASITLSLSGLDSVLNLSHAVVSVTSSNPKIASGTNDSLIISNVQNGNWTGVFNMTGNFIGKSRITCKIDNTDCPTFMNLIVIRENRAIDHIFTGSVATLVTILYINFGAALNWSAMIGFLKKPIGPMIGFFGQFLLMPLISYGLGLVLFPDSHELALGLFFTGVSPAGGASNIWTAILGGNIDLSVTMTTISTVAAFGMMPLWVFTLGKQVFDAAELIIPYRNIGTFAAALIIPLAIGYCIQRYLPRVAKILVRILKPFSLLLILFIIIFAIVTNLYLFELFSWQIILAGLGLPWLGYCLGYLAARIFRQPSADVLAIAIETGIQNTGIAIFLLRFSLPQPEADLTTVIPVSVAIMTPFPLMAFYVYQKVRDRLCIRSQQERLAVESEPSLVEDK